jgi:hypothetical protein
MNLLPVNACFAPPASSAALSALPLATQFGGPGIAAHDVSRYALRARAAAGEVAEYGGDPCQAPVAAANPSMPDAMPYNVTPLLPLPLRERVGVRGLAAAMRYNVRTARAGPRHHRQPRPLADTPRAAMAGTDRGGTSSTGPTASNPKSSDAMPYNVTPLLPLPLWERAGVRGPAAAMPYNVRVTRTGRRHSRWMASVPQPPAGTYLSTSLPGPTATNPINSAAMPYNVRTARTGRRSSAPARFGG